MSKEFTLSIEDKILLAEKVMGWKVLPELWLISAYSGGRRELFPNETRYTWDNRGFVVVTFDNNEGYEEKYWQPETDPGGAAWLLMMLPRANVMIGISYDSLDEDNTKITFAIDGFYVVLPRIELCKGICTIALQYAKGLAND